MGENGAACVHSLSDGQRMMTKEEWDIERYGMLCTASSNFTNWKIAIEQLCDYSKRCTYSDKKAINEFFTRVSSIEP